MLDGASSLPVNQGKQLKKLHYVSNTSFYVLFDYRSITLKIIYFITLDASKVHMKCNESLKKQ